MKTLLLNFCLITLFAFASATHGQQPLPSSVEPPVQAAAKTFQLDSKLMARQMPYGVVLPTNYENEKLARFPVIYLLHGGGGSYKNYFATPQLLKFFTQDRFIFVSVEGGMGFYTDSATKANDKYESYVMNELIPEVDKHFRTDAERKGRGVAGISMGGYGALKFGIKYPAMFALAVSWSGATQVGSSRKADDMQYSPSFVQALTAIFGDGTSSATRTANDLFKLFRDLPAEKIGELPFFYLDCGTEDELLLLKL
ncbi:MAG: alpha/beta hydrolase-fold protein [Pyrinomonadaceae bacterium]